MRAIVFCLILAMSANSYASDTLDTAVSNRSVLLQAQDTLRKADSVLQQQDTSRRVLPTLNNVKDSADGVLKLISTGKVVWTIVVLLLAYFVIRVVIQLLRLLSERSARHRITIKGLIPLVRIIGWTGVLTFVVVGIFDPNIATLVAFSASVGVAVGFAAQDILKNIFGGIVIIFDQPFKVGDKIEIGQYYGEVIEIGLRSTRLITPDDSMVSVPNAEIMNQSVSNANAGEPNCQVVAEVYLPVTIDTRKVRQLAVEAAQVSRYVYLKKPVVVVFSQEIKDQRSYMKMRLKAYVSDIRYEFAFKSDMTERVIGLLIREGVIPEGF
jgi:small-conductance mechanosensitive channel